MIFLSAGADTRHFQAARSDHEGLETLPKAGGQLRDQRRAGGLICIGDTVNQVTLDTAL
jgi:hypothetical protein